jgi:tRNA 2-(methylsulfanyl)-N6-isopentenyladenosine37 hydroxylase
MSARGQFLVPDEHVAALRVPTPPGWADVAVADLPSTMSDHAHAEKKAALNGLSLISREPQRTELVRRMSRLAQEELGHLDAVLRHLRRRGWALAPDRPDRYAAALLKLRRSGGAAALADRLLCAALIEARSCERLHLLGQALEEGGGDAAELGGFYRELAVSEAGHYRLLVELARAECPGEDVEGRLAELADAEAEIITALPHEARIH